MHDSKQIIAVTFLLLAGACAKGNIKSEPVPSSLPPSTAVAKVEMPDAAPEKPVEPNSSSLSELPSVPLPEKKENWTLKKNARLQSQPKPLLLSKVKNKKLPGFTQDICYNYGTFSVVETKSDGELGSAELNIRRGAKGLCLPEFKGSVINLKIIEGHFVGVVGPYLVVDGDDRSEGTPEIQILNVENGAEVFKVKRHPDQDVVFEKMNDDYSMIFSAFLKIKCELVVEGATCWKKVLEQNQVGKKIPMPNCKDAFHKSKTPEAELALVSTRVRVPKLNKPRVEYLGDHTTCAPAP